MASSVKCAEWHCGIERSFKDDGDFIHVYDYYLNTFSLLILFMFGSAGFGKLAKLACMRNDAYENNK